MIAGRASLRQKDWMESIQVRVNATTTALCQIMSTRMSGTDDIIHTQLQKLRAVEIARSAGYRYLLIIIGLIC